MVRRLLIGLVALAALLALAAPARAGGWALITLDALPPDVRAGQAFQVGFVILQHGQTPVSHDWDGRTLSPTLLAQRQGSAEQLQFVARQHGAVGHFIVDVTLPIEGVWEWSIAAAPFYIQTTAQTDDAAHFEPLAVLPAAAANPAPEQPLPLLGSARQALGGAGALLLLAAAGLAWAAQRARPQRAAAD